MAIAIGRELTIDLWRIRTGRTKLEDKWLRMGYRFIRGKSLARGTRVKDTRVAERGQSQSSNGACCLNSGYTRTKL